MNPVRRSLRAFALLIGSYALLTLVAVLPYDGIFMQRKTTSVFYFFPAVFLFLYFNTRIIDRAVRKYLTATGAMIILWCILRAAKYIAFEENETLARYIWYLYYVPMLIIPQLSFQAALSVGEPREKRLSFIQIITAAVTILCILAVLTNDFHQQIFVFHPGFADWDFDYGHRPLFWIIVVWDYLFFFSSALILFGKCRLTASRKMIWIPALYLAIGIIGLYFLNIGHLPRLWGNTIGEFPDISCYTLGGFWILCITIGLVPSNKGYGRLFQETSLAARITDRNYETVFQSRSAGALTKEQMELPTPFMTDENTIIHREEVSGGYAYYQVDVAELNRINLELFETGERIAEEAELIRRTNDLKEKRAWIDARSEVYDQIAVRVLMQSQKIAQLSSECDEAGFEYNMRYVSILAAYIKRISNLMLLSSEGENGRKELEKKELALAFHESVRYLNKAGIPSFVEIEISEGMADAEALIVLYERFEAILEQTLPTLRGLQVIFRENVLKLTFEGAKLTVPEEWNAVSETDDDITFVRLFLGEDGDAV